MWFLTSALLFLPGALGAAEGINKVTGSPLRKYPDPCEDNPNCVSASTLLTQIGYGIQKSTMPMFKPLTDIFSSGDDLIVAALKSSDIGNKANNIKATLLPIQDLEKALSPLKTPVDKFKSEVMLKKTYMAEPVWRVLDGVLPQPLTREETLTVERRAKADQLCKEAGFPMNPVATFQLEAPSDKGKGDHSKGHRRLAEKAAGEETDWSHPQPCSDLDLLLPRRSPARLTGPSGLFEVGDYKQRKYYNGRFGVKPDPLLKSNLDQERKEEARQFMAKNGAAPPLRTPVNRLLDKVLGISKGPVE